MPMLEQDRSTVFEIDVDRRPAWMAVLGQVLVRCVVHARHADELVFKLLLVGLRRNCVRILRKRGGRRAGQQSVKISGIMSSTRVHSMLRPRVYERE